MRRAGVGRGGAGWAWPGLAGGVPWQVGSWAVNAAWPGRPRGTRKGAQRRAGSGRATMMWGRTQERQAATGFLEGVREGGRMDGATPHTRALPMSSRVALASARAQTACWSTCARLRVPSSRYYSSLPSPSPLRQPARPPPPAVVAPARHHECGCPSARVSEHLFSQRTHPAAWMVGDKGGDGRGRGVRSAAYGACDAGTRATTRMHVARWRTAREGRAVSRRTNCEYVGSSMLPQP